MASIARYPFGIARHLVPEAGAWPETRRPRLG